MKKEYVKPEMVMEEFISEIYMLGGSSSIDEDENQSGMGQGNTGSGFNANEHRGSWGDLWN